jgi:hypothetical protein
VLCFVKLCIGSYWRIMHLQLLFFIFLIILIRKFIRVRLTDGGIIDTVHWYLYRESVRTSWWRVPVVWIKIISFKMWGGYLYPIGTNKQNKIPNQLHVYISSFGIIPRFLSLQKSAHSVRLSRKIKKKEMYQNLRMKYRVGGPITHSAPYSKQVMSCVYIYIHEHS